MNKKLTHLEFNQALSSLAQQYRLLGPVRITGNGAFSDTDTTGYGEISSLEQLLLDEKTYFSPKEYIFPIRETLFFFNEKEAKVPAIDPRPVIIFLRPCDINGIKRLDTIFLQNGLEPDFYYQRMRNKIKFFMIECTVGFDSCFCVSMDSNRTEDYSCALRFGQNEIKVEIKDREFENAFNAGRETASFLEFIEENQTKVNIPALEQACTEEIFEHELWQEYTSRCIACGRCNTSCITCSCFSMQDVKYDRNGQLAERRRVWAGCHIDGFTDMAGGHTFRKKNGDRMRFKTMHKINDFHRRFGFHMCVGCGRCDDVCPEYISFSACINKLDHIVKELKNEQ
ncbi:MAG: anaerobic sulfite reductase subunit AsrA [Victivallaceae bacterium]